MFDYPITHMFFRFLTCLLLPATLFAATLRVNNAPYAQADYAGIQAAIDAAADGDTLLIEGSSVSYSGFSLVNKRLNLIGPGYELSDNLGTPFNKLGAIVQGGTSSVRTASPPGSADGSLVMGIEFRSELMVDRAATVTVSRCYFNSSSRLSIDASGTVVTQCVSIGSSPFSFLGSSMDVRIENCLLPNHSPMFFTNLVASFRNNLLAGLSGGSPAAYTFENNIFLNPVSGVFDRATFRNNLFQSSVPTGINGTGNLSYSVRTDLMANFDNTNASFDGRYQLKAPFPLVFTAAHYAGTDGTHIGPFGGANPYILSGVPPLPSIDELSAPRQAAPGSSLLIRVKVGQRP